MLPSKKFGGRHVKPRKITEKVGEVTGLQKNMGASTTLALGLRGKTMSLDLSGRQRDNWRKRGYNREPKERKEKGGEYTK